jgi:hypothetical protein
MSPPTEQLIRDYLNRLSVAARDRLGPDDRRALVDRTRKLIERKADFAGRPTTLEVGKVLARLGDPVALLHSIRSRRSRPSRRTHGSLLSRPNLAAGAACSPGYCAGNRAGPGGATPAGLPQW